MNVKDKSETNKITATRFIEAGGQRAIITSLDHAIDALEGKAGTTINR